jgi:hypothetical protein
MDKNHLKGWFDLLANVVVGRDACVKRPVEITSAFDFFKE